MKINSAKFITSAASTKGLISDNKWEIAFAGKSNVGKSSFINALCSQKKLAKTSSLPGRTRLVNYFLINDSFYFVDLPGYGYAKAGKQNKDMWADLLEDYLIKSSKIKLVIMLVDIRHDPTDLDKIMLKFLYQRALPFKIVATKSDKIAKSKVKTYVQNIAKCLGVGKDNIIAVSSETGDGMSAVLTEIENTLNFANEIDFEQKCSDKDAEILAHLLKEEKQIYCLKNITSAQSEQQFEQIFEQFVTIGICSFCNNEYQLTAFGEKVLSFVK